MGSYSFQITLRCDLLQLPLEQLRASSRQLIFMNTEVSILHWCISKYIRKIRREDYEKRPLRNSSSGSSGFIKALPSFFGHRRSPNNRWHVVWDGISHSLNATNLAQDQYVGTTFFWFRELWWIFRASHPTTVKSYQYFYSVVFAALAERMTFVRWFDYFERLRMSFASNSNANYVKCIAHRHAELLDILYLQFWYRLVISIRQKSDK